MVDLSDNAKIVLRVAADQDMDGYTLRAKTRLSSDILEKVIEELRSDGLLSVKGEPYGDGLLKAWYQVRPRASFLLQRIPLP
jgi:hypothetical protein